MKVKGSSYYDAGSDIKILGGVVELNCFFRLKQHVQLAFLACNGGRNTVVRGFDAHIIVLRKFIATQHIRPVIAISAHPLLAIALHCLAQTSTRENFALQTNGRKK